MNHARYNPIIVMHVLSHQPQHVRTLPISVGIAVRNTAAMKMKKKKEGEREGQFLPAGALRVLIRAH